MEKPTLEQFLKELLYPMAESWKAAGKECEKDEQQ